MEVLVIGLGSMGKRRIRLLKRFDQVTNIVGVDGRADRREEAQRTLGCAVCASTQEAFEKFPQMACAFVCTSPLSHSAIIEEMLRHNLHVFTEINLVADGYARNMRLADEMGKVLFLSSTFYFREEIQHIRKHVCGKENLNYVYHIGQYLPDWHPWENYKDFFVGDPKTNGCREIMAIELPWLIGTFGDVQNMHVVSGHMSQLRLAYPDHYMIQFEHENGNKGLLVVDVVSPKAVRNLEVYGENLYFSWNGSPDSLEAFDPADRKTKKVALMENAEHIDGYGTFIIENAYENEIREFFNVVCNQAVPQYGFAKDLEILKLIDRIEGIHE